MSPLVNELFEPRIRKADDHRRERVLTAATGLTVGRAILTSGGFIAAIAAHSHVWLLITLGASMVLDLLDGLIARRYKRETVTGAQLDNLADRLAALFVAVGAVALHRDLTTIVAVGAVWLQYGIVDQVMSNYFLRFGLWSPDHFHVIDSRIWSYNWSPKAKFASTAPVALLAIGSVCLWPAIAISLGLSAIRLGMYPRLKELAEARIPELHLAHERVRHLEIAEPATAQSTAREQLPPSIPRVVAHR